MRNKKLWNPLLAIALVMLMLGALLVPRPQTPRC